MVGTGTERRRPRRGGRAMAVAAGLSVLATATLTTGPTVAQAPGTSPTIPAPSAAPPATAGPAPDAPVHTEPPPLGLQVDPLVVPDGAPSGLATPAPVATDALPAPTVHLPWGPPWTVPVAPPDGTPASRASRDCGFSIPLRDGNELWVFCDTTDGQWIDGVFRASWFVNSTAAFTRPGDPLVLLDHFDASGAPVPFIEPVPSYAPCPAHQRHVIWPISGTAVPDGAVDRVWIYFENICQDPDTIQGWSQGVGVASYTYRLGDPDPADVPIRATVRAAHLFFLGSEPLRLWGTGAVWGNDGYVYIHRCASNGSGCQAGRVPGTQVASRGAYRFWDGDSWEVDAPTVPTVGMPPGHFSPLGAHHVLWLPAMGVFGMASAAGGAGSWAVGFQVARRPEGPWSDPVVIPMTGCDEGIRCYHGAIHGQGSGIDHVAVTIYDAVHPYADGRLGGMTRWVQARVDIDPPPPGVCRSGFRDVWSAHRFCREVAWVHGAGITGGYPDATFRPATTVSRQAAVSMLWRSAGSPGEPFPDPGFGDVGGDHPFRTAIAWAVAEGIVTGHPDGTFRPGDPVTRQAMAAFLWRSEGSPPAGAIAFDDVPTDNPFRAAIAWMAGAGLTTGYADGGFHPGEHVSRQASAAFLNRLAT